MAAAGIGATALACAGLALTSTPSQAAAPAHAAAPEKHGYAGAPLNPAPYTLTQPDGTTVRVHNFGDHLSHGVATVKGDHTLVQGKDGVWRYAAGLTSSGALKPSNIVAGDGQAPATAEGLVPAPSATATVPHTPKAGTGDDTELVILAQFLDQPSLGSTEQQWHDHYFGATHSVDDFYNEASQGKFGLKPATESCGGTDDDGVTGWITLPYNHPNTGVTNGRDNYVADAIKATENCVDYASYDTAPHDGIIETNELHITVIGAGDETSYSGPGNTCDNAPSIWGHEWNLVDGGVPVPTVDGVQVGGDGYTTFGEWHCRVSDNNSGHKATMGIMAHEFGHDINWPDLYDIDYSGDGIGRWSLMAGGSWGMGTGAGALPGDSPAHPDAWALYYQGWVTPIDASTAGGQDIQVPTGQSVLLSPNPGGPDWLFNEHDGNGQYFLVENREQTGYDVSLPGCGLVVYKIDETVGPGNDANSDYGDPLVKVIQADGLDQLGTQGARGDAGDPYPGSTNNQNLTDSTTPNAHFDTGAPSGLDMHVDSTDCQPTMQIDVNTPGNASPPILPPANDDFANARVVSGASGTIQQSTKKATEEVGEPSPNQVGATVWYRWTAPSNGTVTLTTADSGFDTVLSLFTGSSVNSLTLLESNDDEVPGTIHTSKVTRAVTGGATYRVSAGGWDGGTGRLQFSWNFVAAPPPAKLATTTTASAPKKLKFKKDFNVTANVAPSGATGTVTVKDGSKVLGTGTLSHGTVKIHVTRNLKPGKHKLSVAYSGSTTTLASQTSVTVKVLKKKRHH
jgi:M6 family metalloprotease-like protein